MKITDEIKSRVNICDYVGGCGVTLKRDGQDRYEAVCPFHGDNNPSLKVYSNTDSWYCYGCHKGGDIVDFAKEYYSCSFKGTILKLCEHCGIKPDINEEELKIWEQKNKVFSILSEAIQFYSSNIPDEIRKQLNEMGISDESIIKYRLGYSVWKENENLLFNYLVKKFTQEEIEKSGLFCNSNYELFRNRIIYPYIKNGRVVYLSGRASENTPNYDPNNKGDKFLKLKTTDVIKNEYLYNEDILFKNKEVIITEGPKDAILSEQFGHPAIALLSTYISNSIKPKLSMLFKNVQKVYVGLDNDSNSSGQNGAEKIIEVIEELGKDIRVIELNRPAGKNSYDLADYLKEHSKEEYDQLLSNSLTPIQKMIKNIPKDSNPADVNIKVKEALHKISKVADAISRESYLNEIKDQLGYTSRKIEALRSDLKRIVKENNKIEKQKKENPEKPIELTTNEFNEELKNKLLSKDTNLLKILRLNKELYDTNFELIELEIAVIISAHLQKDIPLWLLIIGVPSSNKTEISSSFRELTENVFFLDSLTENSLISGYVDEKTGKVYDLLSYLDNKCFIVKEMSSILSLKKELLNKILGDLTAAYDKKFAKFMGTRGLVEKDCYFSHIGNVTPQAFMQSHEYMNKLGNRYIVIRILKLSQDKVNKGFEKIWESVDQPNNAKHIEFKELIASYTYQLIHNEKYEVTISNIHRLKLQKYADFLALGRTVLRTDENSFEKDDGTKIIYYKPNNIQTEEPFRILNQLIGLVKALAVVHGRAQVTEHEIAIIRNVIISSIPYERGEIIKLFINYPDEEFDRKTVSHKLNKSYNNASKFLAELEAIGILECRVQSEEFFNNKENTNKNQYFYKLKDEFKALLCENSEEIDHISNLEG